MILYNIQSLSIKTFARVGNKVISKKEMVRTLVAVGQLPADSLKEKGKKVVVPEEIENLFRYHWSLQSSH